MTDTVNGKDPASLTKDEAMTYIFENEMVIRSTCDMRDREWDCLIEIFENGPCEPKDLPEYGVCDQDLGLDK